MNIQSKLNDKLIDKITNAQDVLREKRYSNGENGKHFWQGKKQGFEEALQLLTNLQVEENKTHVTEKSCVQLNQGEK